MGERSKENLLLLLDYLTVHLKTVFFQNVQVLKV